MTMSNGRQQQGDKQKIETFDPSEWLDKPLESDDVPDGQYGARFIAHGPGMMLRDKFRNALRPCMNVKFALRHPKLGKTVIVSRLINLPQQAGAVNAKSNIAELVRALGSEVGKGATLKSLLGRTCSVQVEMQDNGFSKVVQFLPPPEGMMFPTQEEAAAALAATDHDDDEGAPADDVQPPSDEDAPIR